MLAVITACVGLVVVAQEGRRFAAAQLWPSPTPTQVATATVTPRPTPTTVGTTSQESTDPESNSTTPARVPAKPDNLSGTWVGTFTETVEGEIRQFRYTLELSQQGTFVAGKSSIEKEDDQDTFAQFVVRGQLVTDGPAPGVKFAEDLLGTKNLGSSSAAAPRNTQLAYSLAGDQEYLVGEWVDKRYSGQNVSGLVELTRHR